MTGSKAVDWVAREFTMTREAAVDMCSKMFAEGVFQNAEGSSAFSDSAKSVYVFVVWSSFFLIVRFSRLPIKR
jgi:hypothetical protein